MSPRPKRCRKPHPRFKANLACLGANSPRAHCTTCLLDIGYIMVSRIRGQPKSCVARLAIKIGIFQRYIHLYLRRQICCPPQQNCSPQRPKLQGQRGSGSGSLRLQSPRRFHQCHANRLRCWKQVESQARGTCGRLSASLDTHGANIQS